MNASGSPNAANTTPSLVYADTDDNGSHFLGAWTIERDSEVYLSRVQRVTDVHREPNPGDPNLYSISGKVGTPSVSYFKVNVKFNPDLEPYIVSNYSNVDFVLYDSLNGEKYKLGGRDYLNMEENKLLYSDGKSVFYYDVTQQYWKLPPTILYGLIVQEEVRSSLVGGRLRMYVSWLL